MRTVYIDDNTKGVPIGRRQENIYNVVTYRYPSDWIGGDILAYFLRPGESESYPLVNVERGEGEVTVTFTANDLHVSGRGALEFKWVQDEIVAKSIVFPTLVAGDIISANGDPPAGYDDWKEALEAIGLQATHDAQAAAGSAEAAAASAESALLSATQASAYAQTASSAAGTASQDALSASQSAESASADAQSASQSASSASGSAGSASQSAQNAAQSAQSSAQSAQTAQGAVENITSMNFYIDASGQLILERR